MGPKWPAGRLSGTPLYMMRIHVIFHIGLYVFNHEFCKPCPKKGIILCARGFKNRITTKTLPIHKKKIAYIFLIHKNVEKSK